MKHFAAITGFVLLAASVLKGAEEPLALDKKVLSLVAARKIIAASEAEARARRLGVVIVVVDDAGNLIQLSRMDDARQSLLRSRWDLIIVDEAHKMSAYSEDKKTLAYQLGEALSEMTDHLLLMTATPHKGDPENFCLFLRLLDADVYGDVSSLEKAVQRQEAPFYLRRVKEAMVTFPDPNNGEVKRLFTRRPAP